MPAKTGFELQNRDIEIVAFVFRLTIATIEDIAEHFGISYHVGYKRVAKLEKQKYFSRITKQPEKGIWQVGPQGIVLLIDQGFAPETVLRHRLRANELKPLGRLHALLISRIHGIVLRETTHRPEKIVHWQQDQGIWDRVSSRDDRGRETKFSVRPDAYFVLQHTDRPEGKNRMHFFLEADRSTMAHERIRAKIRAYRAYHDAEAFKQKYPGMQSFRVVVVTETRSRADNLRTDLATLLPTAKLQRAYLVLALPDLTIDKIVSQAA